MAVLKLDPFHTLTSVDLFTVTLVVSSISVPYGVLGQTGVYLSLKGTVYANNSVIPITEIGETYNTNALQCFTDRIPCCRSPNTAGEWYFPNGTTVPLEHSATAFYRNRGDDGSVNLNRINNNVMMPTGLFCCAVPDATDVIRLVCAHITNINVQIRDNIIDGATPVLGQSFSLTCSVTGDSGPITVSTYQWKRGDIVLSEMGSSLSFSSLRLFDAGRYTCQTIISGAVFNNTKDIILPISNPVSVSITSDPVSPITGGSSVTVTCTVDLGPAVIESELSLLMVDTQLSRDGTSLALTGPIVTGTIFTYITQLNSFGKNDSGNYTCTTTIRPSTYLTGTRRLSETVKITIGIELEVNFQFISDEESMDINFSLSCNSSGVAVNSVVWIRDGILLENTAPLVLIDASTFAYTNVLEVRGRLPGTYTCQIRGPNNQVLSYTNFSVQATVPPVNVRATRSSYSIPAALEVSWSLPTDGAINITGYRIFCVGGQNVHVPPHVSSIVLNFEEISLIESVSIRSESMQLPSELISAIVTTAVSESSCKYSSDVGIAVGALLLIEGFIAVVIALIVALCWWIMRKRKSGKRDFAVSTNMAYGQVKQLGAEGEGEYEDTDKLQVRSGCGQGSQKPTGCPDSHEVSSSVYATCS